MPRLSKDQRSVISLTLNGEAVSGYAEPRLLLSDFLRHELGATGTHVGCEHGVCGACTVRLDGKAVRSCLTLAVQVQGREIATVEGLADHDGTLSPLQQAFRECFALQCGFCTPGFLMTISEFLEQYDDPSDAEIRDALSGNICRCSDYNAIVAAVKQTVRQVKSVKS
jgi:2-furoyl-CoA dehydrogenase 2Fe-2S iron sulfur subunit